MIGRGDERAVTVQIGAVLLLAILFMALALYQVNTVPAENEVVEINHNEEVQGELLETRNTIRSSHGGGSSTSQSVTLGTAYPTRAFAINPGPMAGTLETEPLGKLSIENANVVDDHGQVSDEWETGYTTYGLTYSPGYNEYHNAPRTIYEHGSLYNHHYNDETLVVGGQTQFVVDDDEINIVTLQGNYSETGDRTVSIDPRAFSTSSNTVSVASENPNPLTITLPTANPDHWDETLSETTDHQIDSNDESVTISLDEGVYSLRMTEVGVGDATRAPAEERVEYLATIPEGESTTILEFRDRFNNPVRNAQIDAIDDIDDLTDGIVAVSDLPETTGNDGRVRIDGDHSTPVSGNTYTWIEETDSDGVVEIDIEELPDDLEEDNITVSATAVSDTPEQAKFSQLENIDLDAETITIQSMQLESEEGGFIIPREDLTMSSADANTRVHVIAVIEGEEANGNDGDDGENGGDNGESDPPTNGEELPDGAVAFDDENGNGQYDESEETYTEDDLHSFDEEIDLVIVNDVSSHGTDASTTTLTIDPGTTVDAEGSDNDIDLETEQVLTAPETTVGANGDITLDSGSEIDIRESHISAQGNDNDIDIEAEGNIDAMDATIESNGDISITSDGVIDVSNAQITTKGNDNDIEIDGSDIICENAEIDASGDLDMDPSC
ncbi:hypothetical protein D8Y22_14260 [Salinadaptatus halalkaliphilus]|uniref:Uncharacterized protein n=1 Tax=Salinadaptatus halalkaliphilus TaxID=2419781 RepID=A0A4S3TJK7_9EURY|nr:hypothetical protein [Salinadaptatus halalkaliphilus]THE64221.1 hypothetical protein D8Y22_14260 [Salinadaptatus halalkaliphilus]